jgi:hypothetical protein
MIETLIIAACFSIVLRNVVWLVEYLQGRGEKG